MVENSPYKDPEDGFEKINVPICPYLNDGLEHWCDQLGISKFRLLNVITEAFIEDNEIRDKIVDRIRCF